MQGVISGKLAHWTQVLLREREGGGTPVVGPDIAEEGIGGIVRDIVSDIVVPEGRVVTEAGTGVDVIHGAVAAASADNGSRADASVATPNGPTPVWHSAGGALGGTLSTAALWWGAATDGLSGTYAEAFDVVMLSELAYDVDCHADLVQTLARALRPGAVA